MELDPVCGMAVAPERAAARTEYSGKAYHFCCASCVNKFRADPEKYLSAKAPAETGRGAPLVQLGGGKAARAGASAASAAVRAPIAELEDLRVFESPRLKQTARTNDYICPMDPEVHQDHPGACPKCGMALEPAVPAVGGTRVEYTCPMHPEMVRSEPGSCPICGMALEPRTVAATEEENPELVSMNAAILGQHGADGSGACARNV